MGVSSSSMQILYIIFVYFSAFLHRSGATCANVVHKCTYLDQTSFHRASLLHLERRFERQPILPLDREAERYQDILCRLDHFVLLILRTVDGCEEEVRMSERETGDVT